MLYLLIKIAIEVVISLNISDDHNQEKQNGGHGDVICDEVIACQTKKKWKQWSWITVSNVSQTRIVRNIRPGKKSRAFEKTKVYKVHILEIQWQPKEVIRANLKFDCQSESYMYHIIHFYDAF